MSNTNISLKHVEILLKANVDISLAHLYAHTLPAAKANNNQL